MDLKGKERFRELSLRKQGWFGVLDLRLTLIFFIRTSRIFEKATLRTKMFLTLLKRLFFGS